MLLDSVWFGGAAFAIAVLLTGVMRKVALMFQVVDVPNARSSHTVPTPRGGGIATVIATIAVLAVLAVLGRLPVHLFAALAGGGAIVAAVGFIDDRRALSAKVRLLVHVAAAVWALAWLGGLPPLQLGEKVFEFGVGGYLLGLLGIVWTLNLFNFMDGIDGIAGCEAVFMALAGAVFSSCGSWDRGLPLIAIVFACGLAGFLVWNWPPAKIFMGDVGSGYHGLHDRRAGDLGRARALCAVGLGHSGRGFLRRRDGDLGPTGDAGRACLRSSSEPRLSSGWRDAGGVIAGHARWCYRSMYSGCSRVHCSRRVYPRLRRMDRRASLTPLGRGCCLRAGSGSPERLNPSAD